MNSRELKDHAAALFLKGKFGKAAEAYEDYCKNDPADFQARLRMGDAWMKCGHKDRAIRAYQTAAEGFAQNGFLPRAIAASKLVLELAPGHHGVSQMLAELYARKTESTRSPTVRSITREPDGSAEKPAMSPRPSPTSPQSEATPGSVTAPEGLASVLELNEVRLTEATSDPSNAIEVDVSLEVPETPSPRPNALDTVSARPVELAPPSSTNSQSRIWLPPGFSELGTRDGAQTELERSLETLSMREGSAGDIAGASLERKQTRFTELEFEDPDSLLGVIEAAAGVPASSPSVEIVFEEPILAPMPDARPVPRTPLFSDLPESAFVALFERCPLRRFAENEIILEQGSAATSFFIICQGAVRVVRQEGTHRRELAKLEEGAFFGEMALLSEAPRTANVIAATDETQALEISAAILTELSQEHPSVAVALKQFCRQRLLSNLLASAPLFKPFTGSERRALIERFRARDAAPGEVLIREGQPSDGLYVLLTGEVSVTAQGAPLATLREGHVFGEMSLLLRAPTNATITTTRRTSFLRLPKADFDQLIMSHPQILELVAELAHERQRQNTIAAPVAPRVTDTMV